MSNEIKRFRGDTYAIDVVLSKNDLPVDFSVDNYTAKFSYKKGTKKNTIDGINGTVDGEITFPFPASVAPGQYVYDIQVISSTAEIQTYVKSTLEIVDDITR